MEDPYAVLGLDADADAEAVKKAWRRIAKETHPDLNPGDEDAAARFRRAQEAYERITSPEGWAPGPSEEHGPDGGAGTWWGGPRRPRRRAWAGPDEDWLEVARWMAVSHWGTLRREVLPRLAAQGLAGPLLVARAGLAARGGLMGVLGEAEVEAGHWPAWLVRGALWWQLRHLRFEVDYGRPLSPSPVALVREGRSRRHRLVVYPLVFWRDGVRDEDFLRVVVQRSLDAALVAVLPVVLGVSPVPRSVEEAREDTPRWWVSQLGWPVIYGLLGLLAAAMLVSGYLSRFEP